MKTQGIILGLLATLFLSFVAVQLLIAEQYGISAVFIGMLLLAVYGIICEIKEYKEDDK